MKYGAADDVQQLESSVPTKLQMGDTGRPGEILEVEDLTVCIGDHVVLNRVSVVVVPGEIVALLGPDGAGKTVFFESLAGLTPIKAGRIMLDGANLTGLPADERARVGLSYLPEEVSIFREMTVAENIEAALEAREAEGRCAWRLTEILAAFNLTPLRDQKAATLSGGERRRCEIARAIATNPVVIMLDEPFRGLDPMAIREVRDTVLELKSREVGVLVSDYDLRDLLEIIDRAVVLHMGEVVFMGSPADLTNNADVRRLYLGEEFLT